MAARATELRVLLQDRHVATITRLADDRNVLAFTPGYLEDGHRPTLSLGFKGEDGELLTEFAPTRTALHPYFSNLLPEGAMRDYLARRAGVKSAREFLLLGVLGRDLPGAVTIEAPELEAELGLEQGEPGTGERGDPATGAPDGGGPLRFSLAGVQLKFSAIQEKTGGLTIPVRGEGGDWIVKLPSATFPQVPENEYSMMELARASGLRVPETRLVAVDSIRGLPQGIGRFGAMALAVRRFDRESGGRRIHTEDFAQVFGVRPESKYRTASYRNLAEVLRTEADENSLRELVERIAFDALVGNADSHLKNWSLIYPDGQRPELSPAYDLVSTIVYLPGDRNLALGFAGAKDMHALDRARIEKFAAEAHLPRKLVLDAADSMVERFLTAWRSIAQGLPMSGEHAAAIEAHFTGVPLVSGRSA